MLFRSSSRSADYSTNERMIKNQDMTQIVLDETDDWDDKTVVCIVDSAYRGLFEKETDYNVAVYVLDEAAFAAGQAEDENYTMKTLWAYSKSGPKKDKYGSLIKVADATLTMDKEDQNYWDFAIKPVE